MSEDDDEDVAATQDGQVGYKRPPKSGQFKKGTSGNRKGRPKRKTSFEVEANMNREIADLILEEAGRTVSISENGRTEAVMLKSAMLRRLNLAAVKGDLRSQVEAMKLILAAERLRLEQKSGGAGGLCPKCAELHAKSDDDLMEEIMELLESGRLKPPGGIEFEIREYDDDDPHGVG